MSNVISLTAKREEAPTPPATSAAPTEVSFEEIMRRNEENRKRIERERQKNNKAVTRAYGLKK